MHTSEQSMNRVLNPKRQAILEAARRLFLAHGYGGASMEAIAEAAPVSNRRCTTTFMARTTYSRQSSSVSAMTC